MVTLVLAHLYPAELNIYGDSGNIIALRKRLEWRGHDVQIVAVEPGQPFDFRHADIVFGAGGQDSGQARVAPDLLTRARPLRAAVQDGLPLLAVGGCYQLLGEGFTTHSGREMPGVGVFRARTRGLPTRMIGALVVDSPFGELAGFENHSGETILAPGQQPLGRVVNGFGNNARRLLEGAIYANAVGTYLHGPVLPKNPALADHLIAAALRRRHIRAELAPLPQSADRAVVDADPSRSPTAVPLPP